MLDRTWIDPNRCERGLDCLKSYRYEWKDKQRIWTAYPLHDWASHGCDALATFATGFEDPSITLVKGAEIGITAAYRLPCTGRRDRKRV
jgi:phage terminase large subunit